jgi:AhpD family alkylhydroperoxidase
MSTTLGPDSRPRVPAVPAGHGGPLVRLAYAVAKRKMGTVPTPVAVTAHNPGLMAGYSAFELATERAQRLDGPLKDLAAVRAAQLVGCEWCLDFGPMVARRVGVSEAQLRELHRWSESQAFTSLEKLALEYAEAMTATPARATDEVVARLREHLDDAQVVELTAAIAIENYRARFNDAMGMAPQGFSRGAFCPRPEGAGSGGVPPEAGGGVLPEGAR